jgi:hypothetical protein
MFLKRLANGKNFLTLVALAATTLLFTSVMWAQTMTTGAITGTVKDPSGAAIPGAVIKVTDVGTGTVRTVTTGSSGGYAVTQLIPGNYRVHVEAKGFSTQDIGPVVVAVSQAVALNVTLKVGEVTQTVEVTGAAPLLQPQNANTTTTISSQQIANLPNPGMDLTYEAQFAPGAVMQTNGEYGNVEYNGLPATSNNFTLDGVSDNDPFLNLNNSGATNLLLGLNAVQEVSVNTTSYAVDQGHLGAAQINYTSKSGTNAFHGNLYEIWNGSKLNAADFFTNMTGTKKPRSNVNQFGGSIGGPIIKNKLFFFTDLEGTRIVIPVVQHNVAFPTAAYDQYVLQNLPLGGTDQVFGVAAPPEPAEVPFYQNMFNLYGTHPGSPNPVQGCPFDVGGAPNAADDGNGCQVLATFPTLNHAKETLWTLRIDQNFNQNNTMWYKFTLDNGTQPTYTDPVNPIFNAVSIQPERAGAFAWTHTFSPTVVNQLNPGFQWYSAIFQQLDPAKSLAAFPINYFGPFAGMGGIDLVWPQGRDVTLYSINDNLSWIHGRHEFKFGENLGRLLVSDHDFGFYNTPEVVSFDLPAFTFGRADFTQQSFPRSLDEPVGIISLDTYAMDTFRITPKLTLIYGLRATWNSDPVNQQSLFARPAGSFYQISHDVNTPLNQVIQASLRSMLPSTQTIVWQPRGAITYGLGQNTVLKAGFGMFSDVFPAGIADSIAQNPPYDPSFNAGYFMPLGGYAIAPGVPTSVEDTAVAANQAFQSAFLSGALSCASPNATTNCMPVVNLTTLQKGTWPAPYSMQWSAGIEHQFTNNLAVNVQYVGTRGVQTIYSYDPNGYQTVCAGCFSPWPYGAPPDGRLGSVTQYQAGANSNYNGLQISGIERFSHGLSLNLNYTYSHCLDDVSNGGYLPFVNGALNAPIPGELNRFYGNCDYDLRHSLNGNYIYQLPFHSHRGWLNQIVGGWQISGTVFMRTGFPFTATGPGYNAGGLSLVQTTGPNWADRAPGNLPAYDRMANIAGVTQGGQIQWLNPYAFTSVVDSSTGSCTAGETIVGGTVVATNDNPSTCQFGTLGRNTLSGPGMKWSDFFLTKRFKLTESVDFRVDAQFYNVFNHPNFNMPSNQIGVGVPSVPSTLTGVGTISSEITPPTGLLGSFLGGDNAVRMIALSGRIEF